MISGRPADSEFASYAKPDIDYVVGDDAVGVLAAQGQQVVALLTSLDEETIRALRYAPGKWTVKEVIGHLIDDERIFAIARSALRVATRGRCQDLGRTNMSQRPISNGARCRFSSPNIASFARPRSHSSNR